ncbi:MAG: signal peptidase II [Alphaproteobacteria bacterium CG11_big_fil_rev_8_21_14_0_20_44_7]|nr:MAG: signal peptidase II [Alphaproteobacteria bacterium CG11_big_fil_rev_8_21_14_0_20_44_7]
MYKRSIIAASIALILDQITKYWVIYEIKLPALFLGGKPMLESGGHVIEVTSFFNLVMVWNCGISFGIFNEGECSEGQAWALIALTSAIVVAMIFWLRKIEIKTEAIAVGLIIGGALGNILDRIIYGAVADFLDFYIGNYHWPAFNIADSCVFIGVFILVMVSFLNNNKKHE